ncbi:GAF and ANTAR domain-containing protein [Amycolatopsis japonica]|uniref:GAF and ANTAR domain-containing protein n=1 Tax=Amycolatopsis japonica TaxID=208439 RepID=UPI0033E279F8
MIATHASREYDICVAFANLAGSAAGDLDVVLDTVVGECLRLLPVDGVELFLPGFSDHRYSAGSDAGPAAECCRTGRGIAVADLAEAGRAWPGYSARTSALGYKAVSVLPLRTEAEAVGAASLFTRGSTILNARDRRLAQALLDVAAVFLVRDRDLKKSERTTAQLQRALDSRVIIEQAKGVLATQSGVTVSIAFGVLRAFARNTNQKLADVASDVVNGVLRMEDFRVEKK